MALCVCVQPELPRSPAVCPNPSPSLPLPPPPSPPTPFSRAPPPVQTFDTLLQHYGNLRRLQRRARAQDIRRSLFDQILAAVAPDPKVAWEAGWMRLVA